MLALTIRVQNNFEQASNSQHEIVDIANSYTKSGLIMTFFNKFNNYYYYYAKFNVIDNYNICKNIAFTFSENSDIFLGKHRKEIQFDDVTFTLSVDEWVECKKCYEYILKTPIQYYIHTERFVPHTIFFRIRKDASDYKRKLETFIEMLIDKKKIEYFEKEMLTIEYPNSSDSQNKFFEKEMLVIEYPNSTDSEVEEKNDEEEYDEEYYINECRMFC